MAKQRVIARHRAALAPDRRLQAELTFARARDLVARSEYAEAAALFHEGLDLDPLDGAALVDVGWCYVHLYDMVHAAEAARLAKACGAKGYDLELVTNWARLHGKDFENAKKVAPTLRKVLDRLIATHPERPEAYALLASVCRLTGAHDEAVANARRSVFRGERCFMGWHELGMGLHEEDREFEAIEAFERATTINKQFGPTWLCLGSCYITTEDLASARRCLTVAAELLRTQWSPVNNLSTVAQNEGNWQEALDLLDRVLEIDPEVVGAKYNRAYSLLPLGRLEEGWEAYDYGFDAGSRKPYRQPKKVPLWKGEDISDKTIFSWREQGIGDEIYFAAALEDLTKVAGHVIYEVSSRLVEMFRRSFPNVTIRTDAWEDDDKPRVADFDVHTGSGSLFRWLRPTVESFPDHDGFLVADPRLHSEWQGRLAALGDKPKVGISWRSMLLLIARLSHYPTLDDFAPVFEIPDVEFVNLQYGDRNLFEKELAAAEERYGIKVHRWDDLEYTHDLEGVAALTKACDLVISAGTTSARLAAALGTPTVMMVAGAPGAYTLMGRDYEPVFPRQKVVSRPLMQPWAPVMEKVAALATEMTRR